MIIQPSQRLRSVSEYYFSHKLREVDALRKNGMDIINLGIGNPDLPPSEETVEVLCKEARVHANHGYQSYRGAVNLRTAIANWYRGTYGVKLNPESEVLPLIGSKEGVFHVSMAFLDAGDRVLVPDPGYATYATAARMCGAEPVPYHLSEQNGWLPDLEALEAEGLEGVKVMWINYPHMPTGAVASLDDFKAIIEFGRRNHILICHDNPYSLILNREKPLSIFNVEGAEDCCIELNSLSKSHHMAGWRVGMIIGAEAYLSSVLAIKSNMDSGMFLPMQQAAAQALGNSPAWRREQNRRYDQRRTLIYRMLDRMGFSYDRGAAGMFVWARAPRHIPNVEEFLDRLLHETGVFITPGMVFGESGRKYIRVSVCAGEDRIVQARKRIEAYMSTSTATGQALYALPN